MNLSNFHKEAHKYIGTPFKHLGRTPSGVDCVGLLILAALDCGYTGKIQSFAYPKEPRGDQLVGVIESHFGSPVEGPIQVNDVLLLRFHKEGESVHVAVITDHPHGLGIIHAYGSVERVVYHRLTEEVTKNVVAIYRWPEELLNG